MLDEGNVIDLMDLCEENPEIANNLVLNGNEFPNIQKKILKSIPCTLFSNKAFNSKNINRIVSINGTVIRAYEVLIKNVTSELLCLKCNNKMYVTSVKKKGNVCESCGSSVLKDRRCSGEIIPSQRIRIQDIGNPNSMSETSEIVLEGELASKFFPGDKLLVTGIVLIRWKPFRVGEPMISSLCMHALSVYKQKEESMDESLNGMYMKKLEELSYFEKRSFLINSFAEEIQGLENVKLGLLLALVSGNHGMDLRSGTRGNSHVLLIGDPGMGKSHLLKTCGRLSSPSVLTNGIGTSQAGLTTCAVRQGKEWTLEAGALVLADMGVCCIDEFNKLRVNEKNGLLEAMEQQTLSIAKAGIVSSLNTRCSIIAASNTRYKYDSCKSISENIMITTPLISRFDLIFGLFDNKEPENDILITEEILNRRTELDCDDKRGTHWNNNILKNYIAVIKRKSNVIPEELNSTLLNYYHHRRKIDGVNEFNTIRMLESLVRLAESHSKLMNEARTTEDDVYTAIILMETAMNSQSFVDIDPRKVFMDEKYHNEVVLKIRTEIMKK